MCVSSDTGLAPDLPAPVSRHRTVGLTTCLCPEELFPGAASRRLSGGPTVGGSSPRLVALCREHLFTQRASYTGGRPKSTSLVASASAAAYRMRSGQAAGGRELARYP